ncbi:MAG TPA: hypothetical protein VEM40_00150 [Nitrospirota bacterium]|nr:hypothetical protein [Nitrospirota bacterium]
MATSTGVTPNSTQLPGFRSVPNVTSPADISGPANTYYFVVTAATGTYPYENESAPSAEISASITATVLPALWAQTVSAGTGTSQSDFNGVSVASDGSVYAAGDIYGTGTYNFGSGVISQGTCTSSNVVLVKYNSSGAAQWARTVTAGSDKSLFNSVAVALDGSVYAAGYIYGTGSYYFGGVNIAGTFTGSNIVLVKYDSTGVAQWARSVTEGINVSTFSSVSVASDGSVYAAGYIQGTGIYNFGNNVTATLTTNGNSPVLVKYDSNGNAQWARTVTAGVDDSTFNGVFVASDGFVYAAGYIKGTGTFDFGNGIVSAGTYTDGGNVALVKYDSNGNAQWAQTVMAGTGDSFFTSVSVTLDGSSVYAAGYIQGTGTYTFGGVNVAGTNSSGINVVLVKYSSSNGAVQQAKTVTLGGYDSTFNSVSVASDGSVYAAGFIVGNVSYGFDSVAATGTSSGENIVLVKYDSTGVASWAQTVTAGTGDSFFMSVSAVAPSGYIYAAGDILGTGAYNFGSGATATGTYNGPNMVLVAY